MSNKILINAVDPEECRIAKVTDSKLEEFHIESAAREITHGNIYKGVITRVEPGLQSVFVDYGAEKNGFLPKTDIHQDYYQDDLSGHGSINNILKPNQELFVQVVKDPIMKKGAMLTTYISLPGRYLVLMPGSKNRGISRKIEEEKERARLKDILYKMKIPEEFGVIVRTAGVKATKTFLSRDIRYLLRLWKNIKKIGLTASSPSILYKERNLVFRSIRDYLTEDVSEILIDDATVFNEVKGFINIIAPRHAKIVRHYKGPKPIFTKNQLERQIASIFENRVEMKSGGSIVIDQTEALVAIDVNSGKGIRNRSVEETAFQTNVEAAEEIARQLRLRDLGGLIVIDFIDMKDSKHKSEVERTLKMHIKADKARTTVGRISRFGLLEMSRQRIRPSIDYGSHTICEHCGGKGLKPSTETLALAFLRKLSLDTLKPDITNVKGIVPAKVADYLLNRKRKEILELEMRREVGIHIEGDINMLTMQSEIICE